MPIRRGEHDARLFDVLARPVAVGRNRRQLNRRQLLALRGAPYHMRGGPVNAPPPDPRVISFASLVLRPSGSSFFCFH
jgi:hypothetical protein